MIRRLFTLIAAGLLLVGAWPAAAPAGAQERTGDENIAVAVNTEDGASVFRLAFSVRKVADGIVDQTNTAVALASCTACQTVALAFQVVLVSGDADVVVPENEALAVNVACAECLTYASATQVVLGFDGPVRLTAEGRQRLNTLRRSLRQLEDDVAAMDAAMLHTEVQRAKAELIAIFTEEVVEPGDEAPVEPSASSTTTTTTDAGDAPTTTTSGDGTTTSTTEDATTTTTEATTTTSSSAPTTTAAP